jgi:hypothetical protein
MGPGIFSVVAQVALSVGATRRQAVVALVSGFLRQSMDDKYGLLYKQLRGLITDCRVNGA